jgi:hypothetical protein
MVIMAADSQITEDNLRTISSTTPKIINVGRYLLGLVGDSRPGDILAYNWKPPVYKGSDPVQWMGKKIMPSILQTKIKKQGSTTLSRLMATYSILQPTSRSSSPTRVFTAWVVVGLMLSAISMIALTVLR